MTRTPGMLSKAKLEQLHRKYNRREYVHPDPLEFLYEYENVGDREVVGLIASSLAYGRVLQILRSVRSVLDRIGPQPRAFLIENRPSTIRRVFSGFRHRFTSGMDLSALLTGIRSAVLRHGSLNACFLAGFDPSADNVLPALSLFASELNCDNTQLLPSSTGGGACKKLNLFLRWMVRQDPVDPGGWTGVPSSTLIIPLDTHMAGIGQRLGLTYRKSANMKMALEITDAFRQIEPSDPVRYDFALTRFGIRSELTIDDLIGGLRRRRDWTRQATKRHKRHK